MMKEIVRYPKEQINVDIFKSFFDNCGNYDKYNTNLEVSPIWEKIYDRWIGDDVLKAMESRDFDKLKSFYEDYYVSGISEGASSGKAFSNEEYRLSKVKRNTDRTAALVNHFEL